MKHGWAEIRGRLMIGPWTSKYECNNPEQAVKVRVRMVTHGAKGPKGWTQMKGPWYAVGTDGPWWSREAAEGEKDIRHAGGTIRRVDVYGKK
jgi:hypothetical protein